MAEDGGERLRALYEQHGRAVLAYARHRTWLCADAEDVLAETFLVAWRRIADIPVDAPRPWLYAVAARVLANQRRGAERRDRLVERLKETQVLGSRRMHTSDTDDIEVAFLSLRAPDQQILRLAAWESLRPAEIGRVLCISPNAASIRLHRARIELRRALARLEGPQDVQ